MLSGVSDDGGGWRLPSLTMAVDGVYLADGEDRPGMMEVVELKDVEARKDEDGSVSNSEG